MADRIARLVDRAIVYTDDMLAIETVSWPTAREGLTALLRNLQAEAPDHPSLIRLRHFIAAQSAARGEIGSLH